MNSTISWKVVKKMYEGFESYDGTNIWNREDLSERYRTEPDQNKRRVIRMFLNVARQDNLFSEHVVRPEKLENLKPKTTSGGCFSWCS